MTFEIEKNENKKNLCLTVQKKYKTSHSFKKYIFN